MTVNKVILVGNLGADPESRTSQAGNTVTNLRIATSERAKDREGNWGDHTEWHRVVCFGRTAETAARFLRKGRQVYIEGKIRSRKWQDREGKDRYTTEVVADQVRFLGTREGGGSGGGNRGGDFGGNRGGGYGGSEPSYGGSPSNDGGGFGGGMDDDIPF